MTEQSGGCQGDPCSEKLTELRLLIDNELDDDGGNQVRQHVGECSPCAEQAELETRLRQLVHRGCAGEGAPAELKAKVIAALTQFTSVHVAQSVHSDGQTVNVRTVRTVRTVTRRVVTDLPGDPEAR